MPNPQHFSLPQRTPAIVNTITRHQQATASQLRRLHYAGLTERSAEVTSSRNLKRLTELGKLRRVLGVHDNRAPEYIYTLPGSTAKPYDHTLDITELYVLLVENHVRQVSEMVFAPEGWFDNKVGVLTVTADAYVEIGDRRRYIEIDLGSERPNVLRKKMRHYHDIWSQEWDRDTHGGVWPTVVWIVHNRARQAEVRRCIASMPEPRLHVCWLMDEVAEKI